MVDSDDSIEHTSTIRRSRRKSIKIKREGMVDSSIVEEIFDSTRSNNELDHGRISGGEEHGAAYLSESDPSDVEAFMDSIGPDEVESIAAPNSITSNKARPSHCGKRKTLEDISNADTKMSASNIKNYDGSDENSDSSKAKREKFTARTETLSLRASDKENPNPNLSNECVKTSKQVFKPKDDSVTPTNNSNVPSCDDESLILFRALREEEDPEIGLTSKNPDSQVTAVEHINDRTKASRFISFSRDFEAACFFGSLSENFVICAAVRIDPKDKEVFDLSCRSEGSASDRDLLHIDADAKARTSSKMFAEVLIGREIAKEEIVQIFPLPTNLPKTRDYGMFRELFQFDKENFKSSCVLSFSIDNKFLPNKAASRVPAEIMNRIHSALLTENHPAFPDDTRIGRLALPFTKMKSLNKLCTFKSSQVAVLNTAALPKHGIPLGHNRKRFERIKSHIKHFYARELEEEISRRKEKLKFLPMNERLSNGRGETFCRIEGCLVRSRGRKYSFCCYPHHTEMNLLGVSAPEEPKMELKFLPMNERLRNKRGEPLCRIEGCLTKSQGMGFRHCCWRHHKELKARGLLVPEEPN